MFRFTLLFVVVIGVCCVAQTSPSNPSPAEPLIQKALSQLTGNVAIKDVTLIGTARRIAGSDDESGEIAAKALVSGDARWDISFPSGQRSERRGITASGTAGEWSGADGTRHPIATHNLFVDDFSWFFPALILERISQVPGLSAAYVGSETRDGRAVERLNYSKRLPTSHLNPDDSALATTATQMAIYLDRNTLLPSSLNFTTHPDNDLKTNLAVEIQFSDYTPVNSAQIPLHVQKFINGALVLDIQFRTATLNSGLSAGQLSGQ